MANLLIDQRLDMDKLSYEIFSILESKFLSSSSPPQTGKVRVLSIDAASDGAVLAALSLSLLETLLNKQTADPSARIADFFDLAAGSGAGGVLVAMLFSRGEDGRPLFTADEALRFMISKTKSKNRGGIFRRIFRSSTGCISSKFRSVFSNLSLRDSVKPVLITCYDTLTDSPFTFSRSDAVESDGYDFLMGDVCAATCAAGDRAVDVRSVDGKNVIRAIGGGAAMGNPTAAAITHVLNNKREFPFATGVEDLLVLSMGSSETASYGGKIVEIAGEAAVDTVDQSVAMAFGQTNSTDYVRIQVNGYISKRKAQADHKYSVLSTAETVLSQKNIESVMFQGKRISEHTNGEKIEWVSAELIEEEERRKKSPVPMVLIKPAVASPRSSSATFSTTATIASSATSASL